MRIGMILLSAVGIAAAAFGAYGGKIVFTTNRDGNQEVYVMSADGSNVARLTNNKAYDDQPALSPDGSTVVFVSNRDGNNELYLVGVDGKGLRRLTDTPYPEIDPSFTPDGGGVIYTSMVEGDKDIWRLNVADGSAEALVTGEGDQFMGRMAADGALVYVEDGGDEEVVFLKDGVKTNLTHSPGLDLMPSFSADGNAVYFTSNRGGDYDLFVVGRDGSGLKEVVSLESSEGRAAGSPDGEYVAVASDMDGDLEIYVFSLDGELLEQLTQNEADDYEPFWGP
jgi:Tol biopolymer transport system component